MTAPAPLDLPQSVLDLVEFHPCEDMILHVLRAGLPDVPAVSEIADDPPATFLLVRRIPSFGGWTGDERFVDYARFFVHSFASDPDGDEKAALLAEAARVVLRNAGQANLVVPGLGAIVNLKLAAEPVRKTDWADSTGPVQYADLPAGMWRYAAEYTIHVRRPLR